MLRLGRSPGGRGEAIPSALSLSLSLSTAALTAVGHAAARCLKLTRSGDKGAAFAALGLFAAFDADTRLEPTRPPVWPRNLLGSRLASAG